MLRPVGQTYSRGRLECVGAGGVDGLLGGDAQAEKGAYDHNYNGSPQWHPDTVKRQFY
jgi:hypothetical protein